MPLFTATAHATDRDGDVEVTQPVVAACDARHAIDLCCAALERRNQRTRRQPVPRRGELNYINRP